MCSANPTTYSYSYSDVNQIVMLFYDIAITFGDEVEKIWKQRFTGATVLWFLVSAPPLTTAEQDLN